MVDTYTRITIPGNLTDIGLLDYGELSAEEMIKQIREHADHLRKTAAIIDATSDEQFQVDLVRGSCVQRYFKTIQEARDD